MPELCPSACLLGSRNGQHYVGAMGTPPLSAHDLRAAAEVHRELGPEYSDAVVESFMAKIEARLGERLAEVSQPQKRPVVRLSTDGWHYLVSGTAIGIGAAGVPLGLWGHHTADYLRYFGTARDLWAGVVIASALSFGAGFARLIRRKH